MNQRPWGYQKESQMTCNEPFGFFIMPTIGFFPAGLMRILLD